MTPLLTRLRSMAGANSGHFECCLRVAEVREIVRALEGGPWQPIETAPMGKCGKPETYFIGAAFDTLGNGRINTATCYRNMHGAYEWWGGGLTPTHWMPIPPLPAPPLSSPAEVAGFIDSMGTTTPMIGKSDDQ